jgi:hypothetical protein
MRRRSAAAAAGLAAAVLAWAPAASAGPAQEPSGPSAEPDQRWIVTTAEGAPLEAGALPPGVEVDDQLEQLGVATVEATASEAADLAGTGGVVAIEPVRELELVLEAAGPRVGTHVAAAHGFDGAGRQVAVVDTGVAVAHPTFAGAVVSEVCFAPAGAPCDGGGPTASGPGSAAPPCDSTTCLHGTHVAGIAVGRGGGGVAPGVARGADLVAVRIFGMNSNDRLVADTASLLAGLDHVIGLRQGGAPIDAVNLSLVSAGSGVFSGHCDSSPAVSAATRNAVNQLTALGVLVVVASGNQGSSTGVAEPACFANAFAVGASDLGSPERVATFTNSGPPLDLLAPGVGIRSAGASGVLTSSGTSAAAPFVAGAVAALRSGAPSLPVARVRGVLADAGVLVQDPARGGFLRLDVAATVLSLGDGVGVGSAGEWSHLRNSPTIGRPSRSLVFGAPSDRLLVGDWNGDGIDTFAVRRGQTVILTNDPAGGAGQLAFNYGSPGDVPLVGDWDGDGRDSIGVRRGNAYLLRNQLSAGPAQISFAYGAVSDVALVGDWDGDGRDSIGLRRGGTFLLRNALTGGPAQVQFGFGRAGDVPVAGDWTDLGRDSVGVRRGNRWFLLTDNAAGPADLDFSFGSASARPLVGNWDGT